MALKLIRPAVIIEFFPSLAYVHCIISEVRRRQGKTTSAVLCSSRCIFFHPVPPADRGVCRLQRARLPTPSMYSVPAAQVDGLIYALLDSASSACAVPEELNIHTCTRRRFWVAIDSCLGCMYIHTYWANRSSWGCVHNVLDRYAEMYVINDELHINPWGW